MLWTFVSVKWWLLSVIRLCHSRDVPGVWGNRTDSICQAGNCNHTVPSPTHTVPPVSRPSLNICSKWIGWAQSTFQCMYNSPGCRTFTAAFHSHISLIENYAQFFSKFPFIKSVHNMTPPFFLTCTLKTKKFLKILIVLECFQFFTSYMILAFYWFCFERHGFYWRVLP